MQSQTDLSSILAPEIRSEPIGFQSGWAQSRSDDLTIDVSVCIANWNCREHLQACLTSLQDYPQGVSVETIVADNASIDGAAEMVVRDFPEVILIRNSSNLGFARASNQAAARARGRYVFFLNNDTVVPAFALRELVRFADDHPEAGMIGPRLRDGIGRMQISHRCTPTPVSLLHRTAMFRWTGIFKAGYEGYRRKTFTPFDERRVEVLMGAAILIRRVLFEACGRWDEDFVFGVEDVELSTRIGRTHQLVYLPSVEVIHHGRLSSRSNVTFAAPNLLIGYVHFFRKIGVSRSAVFIYKLAITLDAPVQIVAKYGQFLWRRLIGRKDKAEKSRQAYRGLCHFLRHALGRFWRA
jgi:N-acetylglucosaminyl-diphospho-decaprenol L-rhamnosyltransferase